MSICHIDGTQNYEITMEFPWKDGDLRSENKLTIMIYKHLEAGLYLIRLGLEINIIQNLIIS